MSVPLARIAARMALLAISESTKIDAIVKSSKIKLSASENDPSYTELQTLNFTAVPHTSFNPPLVVSWQSDATCLCLNFT